MADKRTELLEAANSFRGLSYRLDPPPNIDDGTIDCSLLVVKAAEKAGIALPRGVRTAEQIRWASFPISWGDVKPGDLLFFEGTYNAGPPSSDGHIASHIGFSLGAGTMRMIDAHDRAGGAVQETDISGPYWQDKLFDARRLPGLAVAEPEQPSGGGLSQEPEHRFTFEELYPTIHAAAQEFGADERVMAGILKQESGFRNWRVHHDGTGHGLIGLDDNGMLPDFERWSSTSVGRGAGAAIIPPELQIRYLAYQLKRYADRYGDFYAAARAWHRGGGAMNDWRGQQYEQLIRAHIDDLFANGPPPLPEPTPVPSPEPSPFVVGQGIRDAMTAWADEPASAELFFKSEDGRDQWSEAYGKSGSRYLWLPSVGRIFKYDPDAA